MIRIMDNKPHDLFDFIITSNVVFIQGYNENGIYGYCAIEIIEVLATLHVHMLRYTHNILKTLKRDWITIEDYCKSIGIKRLLAANYTNDEKWYKFIQQFGFDKPYIVLMSVKEI